MSFDRKMALPQRQIFTINANLHALSNGDVKNKEQVMQHDQKPKKIDK